MTANEQSVAEVLSAYNQALNSSDTNAVMALYAEDGVFMPPYSPSAIGLGEVRKAYDAVFAAIKLTVKFNVAEVVEMSPGWVFARTNSAGTTLNHATGATRARREIRSFSFSARRKTASSRLLATAFPPQTHRRFEVLGQS
jgi:uncharacterized protein (TIGR02246 family)